MSIDYSVVGSLADAVRAFALTESNEKEHAVGDGGQADGLLQQHPGFFSDYYRAGLTYEPALDDTWTHAYVKACGNFLKKQEWDTATEYRRDLIVQAYNKGVHAVMVENVRNPHYLARWKANYASIQAKTVD